MNVKKEVKLYVNNGFKAHKQGDQYKNKEITTIKDNEDEVILVLEQGETITYRGFPYILRTVWDND